MRCQLRHVSETLEDDPEPLRNPIDHDFQSAEFPDT